MRTRGLDTVVALVLLGTVVTGCSPPQAAEEAEPPSSVGGGRPGTTSGAASRSRTFIAVADAKVDAANPNGDYGSSLTLRVDAKPMVRSYLQFKLRGLTGTVRSAVLRVWANSRQRPGYRVHRIGAAHWSEDTITFARQPASATPPVALGSSGPVAAKSWTSVDVTPLVEDGGGLRSLVLETTGATGLSLASREDAPHAPRLIVETG
jgi:hypothetical protein